MVLSMVLMMAVAACGGGASTPTNPGNTASASPYRLELVALTLTETDATPQSITVEADGDIVMEGRTVARIHPDGRVTDLDGKTALLTLEASGDVLDGAGTVVARLDDDGALSFGDRTASIGDDGVLVDSATGTAPPGKRGMRVDGASTAGQRRTAMMVVLLMAASAGPTAHEVSAPVGVFTGTGPTAPIVAPTSTP